MARSPTERTRLLPPSPKVASIALPPSALDEHGLVGLDRPATVWTELGVLARASAPIAAGLVIETAMQTSNVLVVGRLSANDLAVVGNSALLAGVTAWPMPFALAGAFTTLSAPLFAQPDQRTTIGLWLQRAVLLSMFTAVPAALLWWNIVPVLRALKQPEEVILGMRLWMILMLPGLGFVETMKAYLQVQGLMHPAPLILGGILPFHVAFAYTLVHHTPLGAPGAAIATACTLWVSGIALVIYVRLTKARECWGGFDRRAWAGWWGMLRLAIPGSIMIGSEWWAFEIVALLAGRLGPKTVAAQAVISTLDQMAAMAPYAISVAISNRIGNLLGLGHVMIRRARCTLRAAFILELVVTLTAAAVVLLGRHRIAWIFTDDKGVAELAAGVAFDGLQNVGAACLRAFGRQSIGSAIHLTCYYLIGLPFGTWLALGRPRWGLRGLWAGQALGLGITAAMELAVAIGIRWEGEVDRVKARGEAEAAAADEDDDEDGAHHGDAEAR